MTPERWRLVTQCVVGGVTAGLCLYTLAARALGGNDATVSAVVQDAARQWPAGPLAAGIVIGHIFWPVR